MQQIVGTIVVAIDIKIKQQPFIEAILTIIVHKVIGTPKIEVIAIQMAIQNTQQQNNPTIKMFIETSTISVLGVYWQVIH